MTDIYYNTHKKLFSVRENGKVIDRVESLFINNPSFIVQEKGRQKVLKEKRKNVHAFVRGEVLSSNKESSRLFYLHNRAYSDYSFAVYDPYDECGKFRVLCILGDIVIEDLNWGGAIKMVHAYMYNDKPQLKVKISD